jgi:hypothetical protein
MRVWCGCGWSGRRVRRECGCCDLCMCSLGGCPKCGGGLSSLSPTHWAREQAKTDAWIASQDGQRVLARLTGSAESA